MKFLVVALFVASIVLADDQWTHESEAGAVIASGNSDAQTYNLKQKTGYGFSGNTFLLSDSYLLGKTNGVVASKIWSLGIRYDRNVSEAIAVFLGYQIDSAPFTGMDLRNVADVGAKYSFLKTSQMELSAEVGYRFNSERFTADNGNTTSGSQSSHMSRVLTTCKHNWNESVSSGLWVEYLQSYTNTSDYRLSVEPSVSVLMTQVLSLKVSYLYSFRKVPAVAGKRQTDSLLTAALVAKF